MPAEAPKFQQLQRQMTAWLRRPTTSPAPAVERRRLDIYRELFFNNVCGFVETAYPVLKSLLPKAEWEALLTDFFAEHHAQSPYFRDISLEFRHWLEGSRQDWLATHPWAAELLHYEWVELAADCAETAPDPDCDAAGDLLAGVPCLRSAVWPLVYRWPVHEFGPEHAPTPEPPVQMTCLLVYRDAGEHVAQLEINPLSARLVELLQGERKRTGRELLQLLAAEAGAAQVEAFVQAGAALLAELRDKGVMLGTLRR